MYHPPRSADGINLIKLRISTISSKFWPFSVRDLNFGWFWLFPQNHLFLCSPLGLAVSRLAKIFPNIKTKLSNIICCTESCLLISNNSLKGKSNISGLIALLYSCNGKIYEKLKVASRTNIEMLTIATIYLFVSRNAHSGRQTMIEPSSIFAFCMIDDVPPKFVSESRGSWLSFKVATYLCSPACILMWMLNIFDWHRSYT